MATLQELGTTGVGVLAPTPVLARAINRYMVNSKLMNALRYENIGVGNNLGNLQASFVYYEGTSEATFRQLGVNYDVNDETPKSETVTLKMLGGAFDTDIEIIRAFGQNAGAVSNWTEQQISQKINAICNGFAKAFIQGDSSKDAKQFDGINKKIVTSQIEENAIDVSALTGDKALMVETKLNKVIAKIVGARPNVILTTPNGAAVLRSLNAWRNRGVEVVDIGSQKYDAYMGVPIVELYNCFPATDTAKGEPVVFLSASEYEDGISIAIPMDGEILKILPPQFNNGKVVETGCVEMASVPLFKNPYAMAKCYLSEVAPIDNGDDKDGGEQNVTNTNG